MRNVKLTKTTPLVVKPAEAAELLAISPRKLWGLTASGALPHIRIGRCVRYAIDDLREMIDQMKKGGEGQ